MGSAFDNLMASPDISEPVKLRIRDLKNMQKMTDDDPLLFYLAEFGFINKLFQDIPREIKEAAQAEAKLAEEQIDIILFTATEQFTRTTERLTDSINDASDKVASSISKQAIKEINKATSLRIKAETYLTKSLHALTYCSYMVVAITASDLHRMVSRARFPENYKLIKYMYSIPVGHFIIVLICCVLLSLFCRIFYQQIQGYTSHGHGCGFFKQLKFWI